MTPTTITYGLIFLMACFCLIGVAAFAIHQREQTNRYRIRRDAELKGKIVYKVSIRNHGGGQWDYADTLYSALHITRYVPFDFDSWNINSRWNAYFYPLPDSVPTLQRTYITDIGGEGMIRVIPINVETGHICEWPDYALSLLNNTYN